MYSSSLVLFVIERNKYCVLLKEAIAVCFPASCGQ